MWPSRGRGCAVWKAASARKTRARARCENEGAAVTSVCRGRGGRAGRGRAARGAGRAGSDKCQKTFHTQLGEGAGGGGARALPG